MAGRIATVTGTMLTPGVSRNGRLYSKALIGKAVARMRERLADPNGLPIVMRTHHDAGDNSRLIVGRLTGVQVEEDGSASYSADLYDTGPGRDLATLVTDHKPALRSVSIYGYWLGPVKTVEYEGESVTTADDLEIDAVDFTASPGVLGATVTAAAFTAPDRAGESLLAGRTPISEAVEATVQAISEDTSEAYTAQQKQDMLDAGQAMKNDSGDPSYPIKSKSDLRKAIRAVGRGGADHDKIRKHIMDRATALGLTSMIPDNWNKDGSLKETAGATKFGELREYYDQPDSSMGAGFCIDAFNGPISLTMRACGIDPAELRVITAAAMKAACDALQALDPDMDADIDVPGAPNADTDGDMGEATRPDDDEMESAAQPVAYAQAGMPLTPEQETVVRSSGLLESEPPGTVITAALVNQAIEAYNNALPETSPAASAGDSTDTLEVPAVSEPITPAAETASTQAAPVQPVIQLTQEQFAQLLATVAPAQPVEPAATETTAPAGQVTQETAAETAPTAAAESLTKAELTEALKAELIPAILAEYGLPARKGYRTTESDTGPAAEKPLTPQELWDNRVEILLGQHGAPAAL